MRSSRSMDAGGGRPRCEVPIISKGWSDTALEDFGGDR